MQTMFKERMNAVLPLEQLEVCVDILDLFETLAFTTPFEALQEIMEVSTSNITTDEYVSRVLTTMSDALDDMLLAFGVEVRESTPLSYKAQLGRMLAQLPSYYLPAEIISIVEGTFDNDTILADLVQLTQGVSVEESLDYLFSVKDELIQKIAEEMRNNMSLNVDTSMLDVNTIDRKRIVNLNRLLKDYRAKNKLTCVRALIEAGVRSGGDFEPLVQQHVHELTLIPADHMTIELLGLAVFSNTPPDQWIKATSDAAGEFTDLLSDHRLIEMALTEYRNFFEM